MSNCIYCGKPVGLFRNKHSQCARCHEYGKQQVLDLISSAPSKSSPLEVTYDQVKSAVEGAFIPEIEQHLLILKGWKNAVENSLHEGILSEDQESRLKELINKYSLSREELDEDGTFTRVVKSATIRDVLNGVIPHRFVVDGSLPINLQKNEEVVWAFRNCEYLEDRTHRQYVGGSHGVSVRIMKGVYYRTSAFKGQAVDRTERICVDSGLIALTNKHLYFSGSAKNFRVSYSKIVFFRPFSDGIGIIRDAANAKLQIFVTNDGWFTHNLATNLARLASL